MIISEIHETEMEIGRLEPRASDLNRSNLGLRQSDRIFQLFKTAAELKKIMIAILAETELKQPYEVTALHAAFTAPCALNLFCPYSQRVTP